MAGKKQEQAPATIEWKVAWAIISAIASALAAWPPVAAQINPWALLVVTLPCAAVVALIASVATESARMFANIGSRGTAVFLRWTFAGIAAHTAWVIAVHFGLLVHPALEALTLLALSGLTILVARWKERTVIRDILHPKKTKNQGQRFNNRAEEAFYAALKDAGFGALQVLGSEYVKADEPSLGRIFRVKVPSRAAQEKAGYKSRVTVLTQDDSEEIAKALDAILDVEVETDLVHVKKLRGAGRYEITVLTRDVMADVIEYRDTPGWSTILKEKVVGYLVTGAAVTIMLTRHIRIHGRSTGGKSAFVHVLMAEATKCRDVIVWTGGSVKLDDFVRPYVQPYAGTDYQLPFDWAAGDAVDTLDMLSTALHVMRYRQALPPDKRAGLPVLIIWLDEFSFTAGNDQYVVEFDGKHISVQEAVAYLLRGGASARVFVWVATQRSTQDHVGLQGGADIQTNTAISVVFQTDDAEIRRVTGNAKLPKLRNKGQFYLVDEKGDVHDLKSAYIQSIDPTAPVLHNGATVSDIAWERRNYPRNLDEGSAKIARRYSNMYGTRPLTADEMLQYLDSKSEAAFTQGSDATETSDPGTSPDAGTETSNNAASGIQKRGEAAYEAARQQALDQYREWKANGYKATNGTGAGTANGVRLNTKPDSRKDRVVAIVTGSTAPMYVKQIKAQLEEQYADKITNDNVLNNALRELVKEERLVRVPGERGLYNIPGRANTAPPTAPASDKDPAGHGTAAEGGANGSAAAVNGSASARTEVFSNAAPQPNDGGVAAAAPPEAPPATVQFTSLDAAAATLASRGATVPEPFTVASSASTATGDE